MGVDFKADLEEVEKQEEEKEILHASQGEEAMSQMGPRVEWPLAAPLTGPEVADRIV